MSDIVERMKNYIPGEPAHEEAVPEVLELAIAEIKRLRDALAIFLGHDDRFQIAVGGNPIAVAEMMESAHAVLARVAFTSGDRK